MECFYMRRNSAPILLNVPPCHLQEIKLLLKQMDRCHMQSQNPRLQSIFYAYHTKFLLAHFLLFVNQLFFEQHKPRVPAYLRAHANQVYEICKYIQEHYEEDLTVDVLTRHFPVSKTQLYYIFKEICGITVSEYLTEYRITQAKEQLINSDLSIEIIGQKNGYKNISSFSRIFKQKAACSPLQYRKRYTDAM